MKLWMDGTTGIQMKSTVVRDRNVHRYLPTLQRNPLPPEKRLYSKRTIPVKGSYFSYHELHNKFKKS
jgi:hypothetical protein